MIDLPTPETDAVAEKNIYGVACKVDVDFARKLERERDELQDALEHAQMTIGSIVSPSDKATLELIKVTKERDEARDIVEQLTNHGLDLMDKNKLLKRKYKKAHNEIEGWRNKWECAVEMAARAENERNEAREDLDNMQCQRDLAMKVISRLERERDAAREECDNLKQELEIVTARLHGKKHPLDNGIPERHEVYIWKNGKYELDP